MIINILILLILRYLRRIYRNKLIKFASDEFG
jgi:hypothetical protein